MPKLANAKTERRGNRRLHECLQGVGFGGVVIEKVTYAGNVQHLFDHRVGLTDFEGTVVTLEELRCHVDRAQACTADIFKTRKVQQDLTVTGLNDFVQFGGGGATRLRVQPAN